MSEVQALAQKLKTLAYIVLLLVVAILILVSLYLVTYMNYVNLFTTIQLCLKHAIPRQYTYRQRRNYLTS